MSVTLHNTASLFAAPPAAGGTGRSPGMTVRAPHLRALMRMRDQLNPRRALTLARAVRLLESYTRGDHADIMWTMGAPVLGIESADADLLTITSRRKAALARMDWDIRTVSERDIRALFAAPPAAGEIARSATESRADTHLAEEQRLALRAAYERIPNLYATFAHLATASWRGFAHAEIVHEGQGEMRLVPVPQWNLVRDGTTGPWRYNPDALSTSFDALPDTHTLHAEDWLIREVDTPLCAIALVKFVRESLVEKDWDFFIEIFGLPNGIVIEPPDVPDAAREAFAEAARAIREGADASLPNGSQYVANPVPRDTSVFAARLDWLQRKLILAGTGGLLTSLAMPQGIGSGAAQEHADVFSQLAAGDARDISELFQRKIDARILARHFPGRPALAYFQLAAAEADDTAAYIDSVAKLSAAGYTVAPAEISERLGWGVSRTEAPPAPIFPNRAYVRDADGKFDDVPGGGAGEKEPDPPPKPSAQDAADAAAALQVSYVSQIPETTPGEFDARLSRSVRITSKDGASVHMGRALAEKIDGDPGKYAGRKKDLDRAINTVATGNHTQRTHDGKLRDCWRKPLNKGEDMIVIANPRTGVVFNYFVAPRSYSRSLLLNKLPGSCGKQGARWESEWEAPEGFAEGYARPGTNSNTGHPAHPAPTVNTIFKKQS